MLKGKAKKSHNANCLLRILILCRILTPSKSLYSAILCQFLCPKMHIMPFLFKSTRKLMWFHAPARIARLLAFGRAASLRPSASHTPAPPESPQRRGTGSRRSWRCRCRAACRKGQKRKENSRKIGVLDPPFVIAAPRTLVALTHEHAFHEYNLSLPIHPPLSFSVTLVVLICRVQLTTCATCQRCQCPSAPSRRSPLRAMAAATERGTKTRPQPSSSRPPSSPENLLYQLLLHVLRFLSFLQAAMERKMVTTTMVTTMAVAQQWRGGWWQPISSNGRPRGSTPRRVRANSSR